MPAPRRNSRGGRGGGRRGEVDLRRSSPAQPTESGRHARVNSPSSQWALVRRPRRPGQAVIRAKSGWIACLDNYRYPGCDAVNTGDPHPRAHNRRPGSSRVRPFPAKRCDGLPELQALSVSRAGSESSITFSRLPRTTRLVVVVTPAYRSVGPIAPETGIPRCCTRGRDHALSVSNGRCWSQEPLPQPWIRSIPGRGVAGVATRESLCAWVFRGVLRLRIAPQTDDPGLRPLCSRWYGQVRGGEWSALPMSGALSEPDDK